MKELLFIPGPVAVADDVLAAGARPMIDHRGPAFAALLRSVSQRMKPLFGTDADVVLLASSGTGGLEAAVTSLFAPGETLLACPVGVFGKRLAAIARTWNFEVEELATPLGNPLDPAMLAARLEADKDHRIRGILLTHNETSTGTQNDMRAIARAIGTHPAFVVVDSVSGLGASEFEMDEWGFDIVVTASQKALAAPPGVAMVAINERARRHIETNASPRFYLDLKRALEFARNGETPWTPAVSVLFALDAALNRYHASGAQAVWQRHAAYASAIRAASGALGFSLLSQPAGHSNTVVAMRVPAGLDVAAVRSRLRERYGIVMGGGQAELKGKILRMGTMGSISPDDVLYALDSLERVLDEMNARTYDGAARSAAEASLHLPVAANA